MSKHRFYIRIGREYFNKDERRWTKNRAEASRVTAREAYVYVRDWARYKAEALLVVSERSPSTAAAEGSNHPAPAADGRG